MRREGRGLQMNFGSFGRVMADYGLSLASKMHFALVFPHIENPPNFLIGPLKHAWHSQGFEGLTLCLQCTLSPRQTFSKENVFVSIFVFHKNTIPRHNSHTCLMLGVGNGLPHVSWAPKINLACPRHGLAEVGAGMARKGLGRV